MKLTKQQIEVARKEIRQAIAFYPLGHMPALSALDALCAAARENVVMRELCEAAVLPIGTPGIMDRLIAACDAYRAMEGEKK